MNGARPYLDGVAMAVLLRRITNLAEAAPTLTDAELADRLVALAGPVR